MAAFNTVTKPSFKTLLMAFDRRYILPDRKYFSQTAIPGMYNEMRNEVQIMISECHHFSLTTDMWTSTDTKPYMSLTIHFLDKKEWKMASKCLQTSFFPENHTADKIADALQEAIHEWQLDPSKMAAITTDNGANMVAAIKKLDWPWLNCFGHNLNLAVTNAPKKEKERTERTTGACHSILGQFSHSWQRKRDLKKAQQELRLPQNALITVMLTYSYHVNKHQ